MARIEDLGGFTFGPTAGALFGYVTDDPDRDNAYGGAGITALIGDRWTASAFYNVDFGNPNFLSNQISVGLNFAF